MLGLRYCEPQLGPEAPETPTPPDRGGVGEKMIVPAAYVEGVKYQRCRAAAVVMGAM